jgi:hypothetical protein
MLIRSWYVVLLLGPWAYRAYTTAGTCSERRTYRVIATIFANASALEQALQS